MWRGLDVQLSEKKVFDRDGSPKRQSPPRWRAALLQVDYCGISHHYRTNMAQGQARALLQFWEKCTRFCPPENVHFKSNAQRQAWVRRNFSNLAARPVSGPKRNWRSALHDALRSGRTAEAPTGRGVRARQRRFPAHARRFVRKPIHNLLRFSGDANDLEHSVPHPRQTGRRGAGIPAHGGGSPTAEAGPRPEETKKVKHPAKMGEPAGGFSVTLLQKDFYATRRSNRSSGGGSRPGGHVDGAAAGGERDRGPVD